MDNLRPSCAPGAKVFAPLYGKNTVNRLITNDFRGVGIFLRRAQNKFSAPARGAHKIGPLTYVRGLLRPASAQPCRDGKRNETRLSQRQPEPRGNLGVNCNRSNLFGVERQLLALGVPRSGQSHDSFPRESGFVDRGRSVGFAGRRKSILQHDFFLGRRNGMLGSGCKRRSSKNSSTKIQRGASGLGRTVGERVRGSVARLNGLNPTLEKGGTV